MAGGVAEVDGDDPPARAVSPSLLFDPPDRPQRREGKQAIDRCLPQDPLLFLKICISIFCKVTRSARAGPLVTAPLTSWISTFPAAFSTIDPGATPPAPLPLLAVLFVKRTS